MTDEKEGGFFSRLKSGLSKSAAGLTGFFTKKKLDAATIGELEESLMRVGAFPINRCHQQVVTRRCSHEPHR